MTKNCRDDKFLAEIGCSWSKGHPKPQGWVSPNLAFPEFNYKYLTLNI